MRNRPVFFLSMEQRTGKTRPIIEEAAELHQKGIIDCLLIIAMPSGAPRNWIDDEVPLWLPEGTPHLKFLWRANKVGQKAQQEQLKLLLGFQGLAILAINGEAIITAAFKSYVAKLLKHRKVYIAADETTLIMKSPGAKRTKTMNSLRALSVVRRCLDGTPTGEGPMDLYSQYAWLDPNIIGFSSFFAFRNHFAVTEKAHNYTHNIDYITIKKDEETGEPIYQHLEELTQRIDPHTFRVLRKDVFKNAKLPIYQKRYFQLTPEQRKIYDNLKDEYEAELQSLQQVSATHVLTRYLRLQQIASGYWPAQKNQPSICPDCEGEGCPNCDDLGVKLLSTPLVHITPFEENPRVQALRDELEMTRDPVIIWGRFNQDIDNAMKLAVSLKRHPVQYDGRIEEHQKALNKKAFQGGEADTFIAKTRAAGRAIDLSRATTHIYYTNEFSLLQRLQSQDRTELGERPIATAIVDLVAEETLDDELLIPALRAKKKITDIVLRERNNRWL